MRNVMVFSVLGVLVLALGSQPGFAQGSLAAGVRLVSEKNPDVHDAQSLVDSITKPDMTPEQKAEQDRIADEILAEVTPEDEG